VGAWARGPTGPTLNPALFHRKATAGVLLTIWLFGGLVVRHPCIFHTARVAQCGPCMLIESSWQLVPC